MSVWRYTAAPISGTGAQSRGEISGTDAAEVRASLRRAGLQVIDLREIRVRFRETGARAWLERRAAQALRSRRTDRKADLYDALATMLGAGLPLAEAVESMAGGSKSNRSLLVLIREAIREGRSLGDAMGERPDWFDPSEVAMVAAGQTSGELQSVLSTLSERQRRAGELGSKLAAALTYPTVLFHAGFGVVIFLSTAILPKLTTILIDAEIEVPWLTGAVMWFGQTLLRWGAPIMVALLVVGFVAGVAYRWLVRTGRVRPVPTGRLLPSSFRVSGVSGVLTGLAELLRAGVPLTQALRTLAPTVRFGMGAELLRAAEEIEAGRTLSAAWANSDWIDQETLRLIEIGESTGELSDILERTGDRQRRAAERSIDRMARLLEPAAIVILASAIGVIAFASVLPLIRLQEII